MTTRLQQNFRGSHAVIVAADGGAVDVLEGFLVKLGLSIDRVSVTDAVLHFNSETVCVETDILFVDGDLDLTCFFQKNRSTLPKIPVIGLVGVEAPGRLKALLNLGATAFLRKPVHVGAIYTSLFLGMNNFLKRRDLEAQLEEYQQRRQKRRQVVKAIVTMMKELGIDDDEAYTRLRRDSMRMRRSLEDYCELYVSFRSTATVGLSPPNLLAE